MACWLVCVCFSNPLNGQTKVGIARIAVLRVQHRSWAQARNTAANSGSIERALKILTVAAIISITALA